MNTEGGFYWISGENTEVPVRVSSRAEVPSGVQLTTDSNLMSGRMMISPNGEKLVEIYHEWGAADASAFARYSPDGEFLELESGIGDRAPYPVIGPAGEWTFSCLLWDRVREQREEEDRFRRQCAAGEALDGGAVAAHLRYCYRLGQNPLPTLRRRFGGVWKWHADSWFPGKDGDVVFVSHKDQLHTDSGPIWQVTWTPLAK